VWMEVVLEVSGSANGGHQRSALRYGWRSSEMCPKAWMEVVVEVPGGADQRHSIGEGRCREVNGGDGRIPCEI
jgi:hypothetical protein